MTTFIDVLMHTIWLVVPTFLVHINLVSVPTAVIAFGIPNLLGYIVVGLFSLTIIIGTSSEKLSLGSTKWHRRHSLHYYSYRQYVVSLEALLQREVKVLDIFVNSRWTQ